MEEVQAQVSLVAPEDREGQWVRQAHEARRSLQVLLLLSARAALVVLASLSVHPYQEIPEPQGHLYHQGFQVDLRTLSTLWPLEDPESRLHPLDLSRLVVQQHLSLL